MQKKEKDTGFNKDKALKKWNDKLSELKQGKDELTPYLKGLPVEHRVPYVEFMIRNVKDDKKPPYTFNSNHNKKL